MHCTPASSRWEQDLAPHDSPNGQNDICDSFPIQCGRISCDVPFPALNQESEYGVELELLNL